MRPLVALIFLTVAAGAAERDGAIVESSVVQPSARVLGRLSAAAKAVLESVESRQITHLSDGLKIKGYVVVPRTGEKLPGVIYNRGGNRNFGAVTERTVDTDLALIASWGY